MTTGIFLFLNIGTSEMMLILFVALFLFGGKKLPELARGLGRGIREFKDASESIKKDINDQINNFEEEINDVKTEIKSIGEGIESDVNVDLNDTEANTEPANTDHQNDISHSDQYYHNYDYDYPEEPTAAVNTDSTPAEEPVSKNEESVSKDPE